MSDIAIRVENLGKRYRLGQMEPYRTLRESLMGAGRRLFHKLAKPQEPRDDPQDLWALKDVSFEVKQGEVVGIIGRNGAGKSTLLKILSRITEPTTGRAELNGRVGSLLEVGTGFHPELTGRENIYLNGAILGMTRAEIKSKFDEIVAFSEVEKFIDTPVKRYSSGMYVRLAFAVAAHLEPEILVVDEVLAVGDQAFQNKCIGKMSNVAQHGRTVLFVSHNMAAVSLLCNSAILLAEGCLAQQGPTDSVVEGYLNQAMPNSYGQSRSEARQGSGEYRFVSARPTKDIFDPDEPKEIQFRLEHRRGEVTQMYLSAHIVNATGAIVAQLDSRLVGFWVKDADSIEGTLSFSSPWLKPGTYRVDLFACRAGRIDTFEAACHIHVSPLLPFEFTASSDASDKGMVLGEYQWQMTSQNALTGVT